MGTDDAKRKIVDSEKCNALCTCGNRHTIPETMVYTGEDAYRLLAEDCVKTVGNGSVLLLEDQNTHAAAGASIEKLLEEQTVRHQVINLPGDASLTDRLADQVCESSGGNRLIIAVGAGTINDLGKYVSSKSKIPYWAVPTAPSMNGYTSSIAAVKVRGVKRTLPAPPPLIIYVNPQVVQNAPLRLRQSGFCDVLAKSVSDIDWRSESSLFNGTYCSLPSAIASEPERRYIDCPEKIRRGDADAVQGLFEGLLYSGVAMSLAGSSAPASGGEHLISHFWDMREKITAKKPELHGLQVGAGVIFSAACYRRLGTIKETDLEPVARKVFDTDLRQIPTVWGPLADEVEKQFLKKRNRLLQFDTLLPPNWPHLKSLFGNVRSPEFFVDLIRRTGFEMTLASLNVSDKDFFTAAVSARTIRDRITVLDISAHAGIIEEAAHETIELLS